MLAIWDTIRKLAPSLQPTTTGLHRWKHKETGSQFKSSNWASSRMERRRSHGNTASYTCPDHRGTISLVVTNDSKGAVYRKISPAKALGTKKKQVNVKDGRSLLPMQTQFKYRGIPTKPTANQDQYKKPCLPVLRHYGSHC